MDISIITPSYRQLHYLRLCAASVADQTGSFNHEHLIHDGGDDPELDEWAAGQSSADIRREQDQGMYDAINRGLLRAQGNILAWLNCDEQYLPGALANVVAWFQAHPDCDILFADVVLVGPDGTPLAYRKAVRPLRGHIRSCFLPTYSAATFFRRRIVDEGNLLETRFRAIADAVWIDGLLSSGYKAGILNEPLAVFTQTGENLGQSPAAIKESAAWRNPAGLFGVRHKFWSSVHRLHKTLRRAYQARDLEIAVHTTDHTGRVTRRGRVGGLWKTTP